MRVLVATPGRFHSFALARELAKRDFLAQIISGFPRAQLKREGISDELLSTSASFSVLKHLSARAGQARLADYFHYKNLTHIDELAFKWISRKKVDINVFVALSGTGTMSGRLAKSVGSTYVCDRGSSHILFQRDTIQEEYRNLGFPTPLFDQRIVERELSEYSEADKILVPSEFVRRSFVDQGVAGTKLVKIPYGSNLKMFYPSETRSQESFDVLFVGALSVRKGLFYLLRAFQDLPIKQKTLTLIGSATSDLELLRPFIPTENVRLLGTVPQPQLRFHMSRAHVLAVPSIEEGLALVMGEAMACGCPVIATKNTGAEDLFTDGQEGLIVQARDSKVLTEALARLHDDRHLQLSMSEKARKRIETLGGWSEYGARVVDALGDTVGSRQLKSH